MKEFVEKLIERLEKYKYSHLIERDSEMLEHCKEKEMDCEGSDCFLCVWDKATDIVNQLAEEYNNGWILCSDRLPDFLDNVLVCTKSGGRTIAHLKHTPIEWRDMHMNKIDDVIAWKYLDAPYQPKGE